MTPIRNVLAGVVVVAGAACTEPQPLGTQQPETQQTETQQTETPPASTQSVYPDTAFSLNRESVAATPTKRALVVAIGNYPEPRTNGYGPINALNDVPLVTAALQRQGFLNTNITTLLDDAADRVGILAAMETLFERAGPDDVVVFHYSGHGDQVTDDDGDELDGYDEVLVPHGAPSQNYFRREFGDDAAEAMAEYAAGPLFRHLRDDELNEFFTRLRRRVGPNGNVVAWMDSCHSGTGTRALAGPTTRGAVVPIGAAHRGDMADGTPDGGGVFETQSHAAADLAPFVAFSASRQGELSWEARDDNRTAVGPLTLALTRALPELRAGDSYQALFDRVLIHMASLAPLQRPQLEGDATTEVFSGRAVAQEPYYRVADVVSSGRVRLAGGRLTGVTKGSRVVLYPIGRGPAAESSPIGAGVVDAASTLVAEVALDRAVEDETALRQSWAYVTERAFGDMSITAHLGDSVDAETRAAIERAVAGPGTISLTPRVTDAEILIDRVDGLAGGVGLWRLPERVPLGDPIDTRADWVAGVRRRMMRFAWSRFLKTATIDDPTLEVRLDVVPAIHEPGCTGSRIINRGPQGDGAQRAWQLAEGDGFLLRLTNLGQRRAFVTVLELYPDGEIEQWLPEGAFQGRNGTRTGDEIALEPGEERLVDELCFAAARPAGSYVFKLFATSAAPLDFGPLLRGTRRAVRSQNRGTLSAGPLGRLLAEARTGERAIGNAPPDAVSTDQVLVHVTLGGDG